MSESNQQWGVTAETVHRLANAPNTVLILRHFATVAQAQGYLTNRELQAAMKQGGIEGTGRVEIYR